MNRSWCHERGVVLTEVVILGFAALVLLMPLLVAVGRIAEARSSAHWVATDVAHWVARHGGPPTPVDGYHVEIDERANTVRVTVTSTVRLLPGGPSWTTVEVRSDTEAVVSPYRSAAHG